VAGGGAEGAVGKGAITVTITITVTVTVTVAEVRFRAREGDASQLHDRTRPHGQHGQHGSIAHYGRD